MNFENIEILVGLLATIALYVLINFLVADWVMRRNWIRIRRMYQFKARQFSRIFARPGVLILSTVLCILLGYSLHEVKTSTDLWWSIFIFLCISIFPTWVGAWILERTFNIKNMPTSMSTRFGIYILLALLLWFAKVTVSDEMNKIFPFDPALMPAALSAGIFLSLAGFMSIPAALGTLLLEVLFFLVLFDRCKRKKRQLQNYVLGLFPIILYFGITVSSGALSRIGLTDLRTLLIARVAFEYDFNDNSLCHTLINGEKNPLNPGEKILFIGSSQERGIAATAIQLPEKPIKDLKGIDLTVFYPKNFHPVLCNQTD